MNMNLITALRDFHLMCHYNNNDCGAIDRPYAIDHNLIKIVELKEWCGDYIIKYVYINENGIAVKESYWYYDCQTALQVEFQDGTKLDFIHEGDGSKRFKTLKGTDITIEDFFNRYIENGYEIESEPEIPIELDDIVL